MFARLRRSPYRNYTGNRYRNSEEREKVLYIMALTSDSDTRRIARRIELSLGNAVRMTLNPASEYEGCAYLKVYSRDACKENMLNILRQRIGVERVICDLRRNCFMRPYSRRTSARGRSRLRYRSSRSMPFQDGKIPRG